jgi:hypothetical protein
MWTGAASSAEVRGGGHEGGGGQQLPNEGQGLLILAGTLSLSCWLAAGTRRLRSTEETPLKATRAPCGRAAMADPVVCHRWHRGGSHKCGGLASARYWAPMVCVGVIMRAMTCDVSGWVMETLSFWCGGKWREFGTA